MKKAFFTGVPVGWWVVFLAKYPVTAVIIGAGHRSLIYADYALTHPERLKIVGVAEPDEQRRNAVAQKFGIPAEHCFATAAALAAVPRFADAAINGTMDKQHVVTSLPILEKGYDLLLEKPFAVNEEEVGQLLDAVRLYGNKVMVCHVLRYSPLYAEAKRRVVSGELGDIINIQLAENISYHHMSTSYVRGKWANSDVCRTPMLLAKCCHDVDLMTWLMEPDVPVSVSSFGSKFQFRPENAPKEAGTRCLVDCPLVDSCRYSVKKLYLENPDQWECYVWHNLEGLEAPTDEDRLNELKFSPYGRCIYKCDNNVVDHQSVLVNFASGATGTHNMTGGSAESLRTLRIVGTKGELYGEFERNTLTVRHIDPRPGSFFDVEEVDLNAAAEGHGGGDEALIADFVRYVAGEPTSISCTSIFDSVAGHRVIFCAERSRLASGEPEPIPTDER